MNNNTKSYPRDFTSKELNDAISKLANMPLTDSALSTSLYVRAMIGLVELQGRQNDKMAKLSLVVAGLALIVAILSYVNTHPQCQIQKTEMFTTHNSVTQN